MHYSPRIWPKRGPELTLIFLLLSPRPVPPLAPRARLPYQGQIPAGPFARQWPKFTFYVSVDHPFPIYPVILMHKRSVSHFTVRVPH